MVSLSPMDACITCPHELILNRALSPLISTMPHFAHHRGSDDPPFPPAESLVDDTSQLHLAASGDLSPTSSASSLSSSGSTSSGEGNLSNPNADKVYRSKSKARRERHDGSFKFTTATQRRACFSNADNRCRIRFGPEVCTFRRHSPSCVVTVNLTGCHNLRLLLRIHRV